MKHHVPTAFFHEASWVSVRRRASMGLLDPLPTLARFTEGESILRNQAYGIVTAGGS